MNEGKKHKVTERKKREGKGITKKEKEGATCKMGDESNEEACYWLDKFTNEACRHRCRGHAAPGFLNSETPLKLL